ncbi:putative glycine-rich cell wall structural protein 1 protein [Dichotomopilus funicola]|uniref:Glycine-rich cell wall structural protein 1 protein n=1 Tax=Dichotomopilus funicola TaxID=1934379 RepID=A0AAN6V2N1_9PEZI|nr:putative glycine-rich cell wall structural protein 1 protein [Dichotomopilus funicola]
MDTINKVTSAASKAIWGENHNQSHEEPVSGKLGNVEAGEPYDAGNIETKTGTTDTDPAGPAKSAPSATGIQGDSTKAQNDTRSPQDESITEPGKSTNVTDDKVPKPEDGRTAEKNESLKTSDEEVKVDGPGPRPLEEVAREHGGDAGASGESVSGQSQQQPGQPGAQQLPEDASTGHKRQDSGKGLAGENNEEGGEQKGKQEGTGEEYVKSSGLAADGGDFDASRPGAGREADRLLEEKGVHPGAGSHHGHGKHDTGSGGSSGTRTSHGGSAGSPGKEKIGLKDKIKAKLHKSSTSS